ncbi:CBM_collapsed_G0043220.mRNA.1.CDS.1 [Saccharomyces cerevisiae]|nr:CBM_collapsed_G0043220.mRNA.1.CDS.1 [Saccharomyces cerevisiae]
MKVATLRRILVENNVDFPSNARKNALVGLFDEKVKPQIPQLRKMYLNVRPSDEGIVKMDRPSSSPSIASPRRSRRARREKSASPMAKQFKKNRILDDVSNDDDDDDDDDDNDKKDDPLIVPSGTDTDEVDDEEDDVITSSSNKSDTNDFQQNSDTRKKRKDPDSDDWSESNSKENKIDNKHLNLSIIRFRN